MEISLWQAILIGIVYYLGTTGTPWLSLLGSIGWIQKPLIAGTIVGFILGDPVQGLIIGAAIQLPYIAFISAGGTMPLDPGLAGTLGTALALAANADAATAIAISTPLALLGTIIWIAHMTIDSFFVHWADKAADEGNLNKINFIHIVPPQIVMFLMCTIPVALGAYYGADLVSNLIAYLEGTPLHVMQVIGGLLPALGIAMNLRSISRPNTIIFFILGFVLTVYFEISIIVVAIIGGIIAYFYTMMVSNNENIGQAV